MKKLCLLAMLVLFVGAVVLFPLLEREPPAPVVIETVTDKEKNLRVVGVCQYPELPTGCESAAAVAVLRYYGVEITAAAFAREWLTCSRDFYTAGGALHGPDPNEVFAGDPFSENAFGCFAGPIVTAVNDHSAECGAVKVTGKTLDELCADYVEQGQPVVVWATMGMKASKKGKSWRTPRGTTFTWPAGEHALVLVGYDEEYYFFMDPQSGSTVGYQHAVAQKRFEELGSQAVCIYKK